MKLGLGIDTGGTFTDGVIYDYTTKQVISSVKSPTTIGDLNICINNILNHIEDEYIKQIQVVSLSTTLVTNAAVEGKGSKGKLVFIGCKQSDIIKLGNEYGLPPASDIIFVDGEVSMHGKEIKQPDWKQFTKQIIDCGKQVDSFAIVQVWGTVNPVFEVQAKDMIKKVCDKPVICGHELSSKLNYLRRGVSALLNVRLIPIFNHFLDAVKLNLIKKGINVPLLIVRCDGSVMTEEYARSKPVDTILSGPAASIAGGLILSGKKEAVIIDMGGTTTDLGIVDDGTIQLIEEGATIGNYKTATPSIDMVTRGIGGDSEIIIQSDNKLKIGPKRVEPISLLASKHPEIITEIKSLFSNCKKHVKNIGVFYYLIGDKPHNQIVKYLKNGPKNVLAICENCDISIYNTDLDYLVNEGIIMKCAITPTDVAHFQGEFTKWDVSAAKLIVELFYKQYGITTKELLSKVSREVGKNLYSMIVKKIYSHLGDNIITDELLTVAYDSNHTVLDCKFDCHYPIIGLGAPSYLYLPNVAKKLQTTCINPEYASVANALGAIAGEIRIAEKAEITTLYDNNAFIGYHVQSSVGVELFEVFKDARKYVYETLTKVTKEALAKRGASQGDVEIKEIDHSVKSPYHKNDGKDEFLFRFVNFEATGRCEIVKSGIIKE